MQKYVPLVKQNVMKLEVFILAGQRIDQKIKKGWWRGRREGIEKGSRERIEIERKETKGNQCCQSVGFCSKSQDFGSSDLLIIISKLGMLGFFFNMAPLSTIHLQTILGFLNQVLRILVKNCWQLGN